MVKTALTGNRIRERRMQIGLRQSALAKAVGISASYLNLIEHNRRRIGGKLLLELSRELRVDVTTLREGAEAQLLEGLRRAAFGQSRVAAELDDVEEFAGRFAGWAALVADQHSRILALEQTVAALVDRLSNDPQLAASMHEVLSVVTAIRSTSAILADSREVDPEWQARFHRNLYEDSQRLARASQVLVDYLESTAEDQGATGLTLPQEEFEAWLGQRGFHIGELEGQGDATAQTVLTGAGGFDGSPAAVALARKFLTRYARDVAAMPLAPFVERSGALAHDPAKLTAEFGGDLAAVLRRMASVPVQGADNPFGLVTCDSSGALTLRKPVDGFALPQFGAPCPLWPLYQALAQPMTPIRRVVEQSGRQTRRFLTYAISQPAAVAQFNTPQIFEATMLILPVDWVDENPADVLPVGSGCRICVRKDCHARREAAILTEGF